jgi:flagellar biosynthesis GTPase FlhF
MNRSSVWFVSVLFLAASFHFVASSSYDSEGVSDDEIDTFEEAIGGDEGTEGASEENDEDDDASSDSLKDFDVNDLEDSISLSAENGSASLVQKVRQSLEYIVDSVSKDNAASKPSNSNSSKSPFKSGDNDEVKDKAAKDKAAKDKAAKAKAARAKAARAKAAKDKAAKDKAAKDKAAKAKAAKAKAAKDKAAKAKAAKAKAAKDEAMAAKDEASDGEEVGDGVVAYDALGRMIEKWGGVCVRGADWRRFYDATVTKEKQLEAKIKREEVIRRGGLV